MQVKKELREKGKELAQKGYDYVIIDGNPRSIHEDPELIEVIAKLSDLNLIISLANPRDLKAQIKYVGIVKSTTSGTVRILWNFFQKNTPAHRDGMPEGEKLLNLSSLKTKLGLRVAYQDIGYAEGYIGNLSNSTATKEVQSLGNEVKWILYGQE